MIRRTDIDAATYIIDTSGAVAILSDGIRTDRRGRKDDPNKLRLLLIGMLLCIHEHGRAMLTDVHELLTTELPVGVQFTLGVRRWQTDTHGAGIWILPIHDLYELSAKVTNKLGYGEGKHPDLDPAERERRHRVALAYNDALMDAFDLGWTSSSSPWTPPASGRGARERRSAPRVPAPRRAPKPNPPATPRTHPRPATPPPSTPRATPWTPPQPPGATTQPKRTPRSKKSGVTPRPRGAMGPATTRSWSAIPPATTLTPRGA
ncbi:MAG: hypothetical protein M0Z82_02765 [Actinomycetota bacterium]|nr:hypothetical protein [Actinomycetota bacterium]